MRGTIGGEGNSVHLKRREKPGGRSAEIWLVILEHDGAFCFTRFTSIVRLSLPVGGVNTSLFLREPRAVLSLNPRPHKGRSGAVAVDRVRLL